MPELPEVETVRRILESRYLRRTIVRVEVLYPKMIHSPLDEFVEGLKGKTLLSVSRKGKYLLFHFDGNQTLISHLRMEGKYRCLEKGEKISPYARVLFHLDDGTRLCYEDSRRFGVMSLCPTDRIDSNPELCHLGPEPFDVDDPEYLFRIFRKTSTEIKTCLLDQSILSGLGNIYCDEVLFKCRLNPFLKADALTKENCRDILTFSVKTLNDAILAGGSTVSSYHPDRDVSGRFQHRLNVYGKAGKPCPICATRLLKSKLHGRGTTYCPRCQNVGLSVAITGKIASGKSTVLRLFKAKGVPVLSSDEVVRELYGKDEVKKQMVVLFSEQVLNDNQTISRGYLRQIVEKEPAMKKKLEALIHPLVKESVRRFLTSHKTVPLVAVEVPLLFETRFHLLFDYVIGVTCSSASQIEHLRKRNTPNIAQALSINSTSKFDHYAYRCDYLIENDGVQEDLEAQFEAVFTDLSERKR